MKEEARRVALDTSNQVLKKKVLLNLLAACSRDNSQRYQIKSTEKKWTDKKSFIKEKANWRRKV